MSKVIAVCGKICSGKTSYCKELKVKHNAVILSTDEIFLELFHHKEAQRHDEILLDIKRYLHKKALEITATGCDVILDWGFWCSKERSEVTAFYQSHHVPCEWHYIDISNEDWFRNISHRNQHVSMGRSSDYFVDDGLLQKLLSQFEPPHREEIDVWYDFQRN